MWDQPQLRIGQAPLKKQKRDGAERDRDLRKLSSIGGALPCNSSNSSHELIARKYGNPWGAPALALAQFPLAAARAWLCRRIAGACSSGAWCWHRSL